MSILSIEPLEMGERIKKQRLLLGYSREKLAEMVGITPRYCYDLELGLKNMSTQILCKLSESLHVSTDYLLFGKCSASDESIPLIGLISVCPTDKLHHLEEIVSHYIQAVQDRNLSD